MHEKIKNYLAERFITPTKPRSKFVKALMEAERKLSTEPGSARSTEAPEATEVQGAAALKAKRGGIKVTIDPKTGEETRTGPLAAARKALGLGPRTPHREGLPHSRTGKRARGGP